MIMSQLSEVAYNIDYAKEVCIIDKKNDKIIYFVSHIIDEYNEKKICPTMDTWGTPALTELASEHISLLTTYRTMSSK